MTTKKKLEEELLTASEDAGQKEKTCFIIMPIADSAGYDTGHFNRVYKHLIKPACEKAGFKAIRADESNTSNMIVLDILKKIVESEMAICDLSSRNPNVMYELGLRQAFNKKTILIKDTNTISPFDVQAFRYAEYDQKLRIDNVSNEIDSISMALISTYNSNADDINSIVQLLKIEPAKVGEKTVLSKENTVLLDAIANLSNRVNALGEISKFSETLAETALENMSFRELLSLKNGISVARGRSFYYKDQYIGEFQGINPNNRTYSFKSSDNGLTEFPVMAKELEDIIQIPF
ncbi:TPA: hypothetical protein ACGJ08_001460 [Yersinia enterocolitica]